MYMKKAKITLSLLLSAVLLVCALAPMSYASVAGANEAVKLAMTDAGADYEKYESDKFLPYMNEAKYKENLNENWEAGNYEVSFIFKGVQYNYVVDAKTWEFISKEEIIFNSSSLNPNNFKTSILKRLYLSTTITISFLLVGKCPSKTSY